MNIDKAIEVLKKLHNWLDYGAGELEPTANTVMKAIDTVLSSKNTEKKIGLDDRLQEKSIEQPENQESLSYKKDRELPTDDEIIEKAYKAYPGNNLTSPVNAFKYGAKWMRDLIEGRPQ